MFKRVNVRSTPTALYKHVYVLKREIVCQLIWANVRDVGAALKQRSVE